LLIGLQQVRQAIEHTPHPLQVIDPPPIFMVALAEIFGIVAYNLEEQGTLFVVVGVFRDHLPLLVTFRLMTVLLWECIAVRLATFARTMHLVSVGRWAGVGRF